MGGLNILWRDSYMVSKSVVCRKKLVHLLHDEENIELLDFNLALYTVGF